MDLISQDEDIGSYCSSCKLRFETILDADGKIRCPICKKTINEKSKRVVQLGRFTYRCSRCDLKFGAVPKGDEPVKCPVCHTT